MLDRLNQVFERLDYHPNRSTSKKLFRTEKVNLSFEAFPFSHS